MTRELGAGWAETELGPLFIACTDIGVCSIALQPDGAEREFEGWRRRVIPESTVVVRSPLLDEARRQLTEFAGGERRNFDVQLDLFGTEFQRQVWSELRRIPFGVTRTYGEVARAIHKPGASRAVGLANNRNRVPILVPCHRVVAANGLGGFAGGLDVKRRLLALEGALLPLG